MCGPEWLVVAGVGVGLGASMLVFWRPMAAHFMRELEAGSVPFGRLNSSILPPPRAYVVGILAGGLAALAAGLGLLALCSGVGEAAGWNR